MPSAYLFQDSWANAKLLASIVDGQMKVSCKILHPCLAFCLPNAYFSCLLRQDLNRGQIFRGILGHARGSLWMWKQVITSAVTRLASQPEPDSEKESDFLVGAYKRPRGGNTMAEH